MEFNIVKLQIEDREIFGGIQTHPTKTPKSPKASGASWRKKPNTKNVSGSRTSPKSGSEKLCSLKKFIVFRG